MTPESPLIDAGFFDLVIVLLVYFVLAEVGTRIASRLPKGWRRKR